MKKVLAMVALLALCAGAAYGTTTWALPSTAGTFTCGSAKTLVLKPSANVGMAYDGGSGTAAGLSYVVGTYHGQGSRVYGTSSTDTNIFYKDLTTSPGTTTALTGVDLPAAPTPPNAAFTSGWTASK